MKKFCQDYVELSSKKKKTEQITGSVNESKYFFFVKLVNYETK